MNYLKLLTKNHARLVAGIVVSVRLVVVTSLVLAAGGENLSWYVDGAPLSADSVSGRVVWRPAGAGFYRLTVSDDEGRKVTSKVRILGN